MDFRVYLSSNSDCIPSNPSQLQCVVGKASVGNVDSCKSQSGRTCQLACFIAGHAKILQTAFSSQVAPSSVCFILLSLFLHLVSDISGCFSLPLLLFLLSFHPSSSPFPATYFSQLPTFLTPLLIPRCLLFHLVPSDFLLVSISSSLASEIWHDGQQQEKSPQEPN